MLVVTDIHRDVRKRFSGREDRVLKFELRLPASIREEKP
jgi:hypothetical protein